ncbi:MAG: squalene synthase HpnC [Chloracidobacterium sp.]|uniref:squalene synthase HpnC n=1 Tax=Chloracidobacterium validum TaxID=2821543 RepID=UPI001FE8EA68|nr:squalene synthase HpnC [Chloracidobacterium validum]
MPLVSPTSDASALSPADAYAHCRRVALGHYENFPVGSLVLPASVRPHVYAVYAFARAADDFADEGTLTAEQRLASLADWRRQLVACPSGNATHPVFVALGHTIRQHALPMELFHDLLDAFELDVRRARHATFDDLLDYSRRSANPVGRLILLLFGHRDPDWHRMADAICTALQLTNFWQDILVDLQKDRIYLPLTEMAAHGYGETDLLAHRYTPAFVALMDSLAQRTAALFEQGRPLCALAPGRLGVELRLIWLGGTTILRALRQMAFNVFERRPTLSLRDKARMAAGALRRTAFSKASPLTTLRMPA